jgi:endonuclease YncB( thermonuclease family)
MTLRHNCEITLVVAFITAATANADVLQGNVTNFIDGDIFELAGENVRLKGVDAPEYSQSCKSASGKGYACGKESLNALKRMIGNTTDALVLRAR